MERNKNLEALRAFAISGILLYHYTITIGYGAVGRTGTVMEIIAQFAMHSFYVLSGFGCYLYLHRKDPEQKGQVAYGAFLKRRLRGILPAYWLSLAVILLTVGTAYWSDGVWPVVPVYVFFLQNLFLDYGSMLNGATWTIALLMQFYLVVPFLYKAMNRWGWRVYPVAVAIAVAARWGLCAWVRASGESDMMLVMVQVRQLITTLDVFVAGMLAGQAVCRGKQKAWRWGRNGLEVLGLTLCAVAVVALCMKTVGLYMPTWGSRLWQSALGALVAALSYVLYRAPLRYTSLPGRFVQFIASVEYNTYLWHMILISSMAASGWYQRLALGHPYLLTVVMFLLALGVGKLSTVLTTSTEYRKWLRLR